MKAKIINKKVVLEKNTVCCGDKNSQSVTFTLPAIWDGVKLENMLVFIKTENALGAKCKTLLKGNKSGDNLLIDWLLGAESTLCSGDLKCQLVFEDQDGEVILNSEIFTLFIHSSISENGPKATPEYNHISQMEQELIDMLNSDVLKVGDLVSKLQNDSNYISEEEASEKFMAKNSQILPAVTNQNSGEVLTVSPNGEWVSKTPEFTISQDCLTMQKVTLNELKAVINQDDYQGCLVGIAGISSVVGFWTHVGVIANKNLQFASLDSSGIIEFDIEYDTPLTLTSFTDFVKTDLSHLLTDENFAFYVYKKVGV